MTSFREKVQSVKKRTQYNPFRELGKPIMLFPESAMDDFIRDLEEDRVFTIHDSPRAILEETGALDRRYGEGGDVTHYINPNGIGDVFFYIRFKNGKIISHEDIMRSRRIDLDEVDSVIFEDGYGWSVFGSVAISINEDAWLEDLENGVPEGQRTMIYYLEFI